MRVGSARRLPFGQPAAGLELLGRSVYSGEALRAAAKR